jgi:hypothetical protein
LDLTFGDDEAHWMTVVVEGTKPGKRYGHSIVFYRKQSLLIFGGYNDQH